MPVLPPHIMDVLAPFAPLFSSRVWPRVCVLVLGAILAPGDRMVSSVLRVMGLAQLPTFQNYHRVLNRARWSSLAVSRVLLGLLLVTFVPTGPLVVGIDESIERRRGPKIRAAGRYRDPVRSTQHQLVKVRGVRWISLMLLGPVPWANRVWALPFLTALTPSARADQVAGRRHKTIAVWARQLIRLLHRWYPTRSLVIVGDGECATIDLLRAVRPIATVITRLRTDAQLYAPPPPRLPGQRGRTRQIGPRLPSFAARLADASTPWRSVVMPCWYGERDRPIELVSETAIWYTKNGSGRLVPVRWVLIRDPGSGLHRKPSCARIWRPIQSRSSPGSSAAGRSRSPSTKCGRTWESRPNASGRIGPWRGPPRRSLASSRW